MIRACRASDASQVCEIYNHYVLETVVTFEEVPVCEREMGKRLGDLVERFPWFVWEDDGRIAGYATLRPGELVPRIAFRWRAPYTCHEGLLVEELARSYTRRSLRTCGVARYIAQSASSRCPTQPASRCMRTLDSRRSGSLKKSDGSLSSGSTSGIGSWCSER